MNNMLFLCENKIKFFIKNRLVKNQTTNIGGSSNSQFEPADKNSNSRGFLQSAQPYGSKSQFENGEEDCRN